MKPLNRNNEYSETRYKIRVMASVIAVEVLLIALVRFWPANEEAEVFKATEEAGVTTIVETPVRTSQAKQPPPPPSPQIPVEVPDDVIIEQEIEFLDFSDAGRADKLTADAGATVGSSNKIYKNPELAPSILYIVEPTIENKTDKKALIYISFLVDKEGNVEEATVERILLFDDEGNPSIEVQQISERVLTATVKAALEWKFRPAKVNGQPVRAITLHTFTVDY